MAEYLVQDTELTAVADAIRAKGGTTDEMAFPDGFVSAVEDIETGLVVERTAWYRPPDMPDYDSLNLPDDEAYAFFTYDTEIPIAESFKKATFGWYFYSTPDGYYRVHVDRGHIANGEFVIDERILENQYFANWNPGGANITLPTDAGRFVVYRISSTDPKVDVNAATTKLMQFTDEYGNEIPGKSTPCVETFLWNYGGNNKNNVSGGTLTTNYTLLYTTRGCCIEGGTSEFWNNETQAPYVAIYDHVIYANNFGYLPFTGLRGKCKALYITDSELQMGSKAQNQFQNASGLEILDFSGSTIIATGMNNCFSGCTSLRRLDLSGWVMTGVTTMNNVFYNMTSLVELTLPDMPALSFALDKSTLLTVESLNQIISVLPQLEEGVSCTLTLGATNTAKLTEDELAVATGKGWTVA